MNTTRPHRGGQGFASEKDAQKRREIARLGGIRVHELGKGHQWTREEATEASRIAHERRREKMLEKRTTEQK